MYLKGETKRKKAGEVPGVNNIPVTQIDLSVPLHVPASEKYMNLGSGEDGGKKSKKKKKRRKKGQPESDSDEDIPAFHQVSTLVEMPEGATLSDKDENDASNAEFRKLDMDLDKPLGEEDKLPVRMHRTVPENSVSDVHEDKVKHRKEREGKKKKKRKDDKKEKKRKKKSTSDDLVTVDGAVDGEERSSSLLAQDHEEIAGDMTPGPVIPQDVVASEDRKNSDQQETNDIDFWLSGSDATIPSSSKSTDVPEVKVDPVLSTEEGEPVKKSSKKKKDKSSKKEKREKKEKKKHNRLKADYEEAEGITTPSKEQVSPSQLDTPISTQPLSKYMLLAENSCIKMMYETRVSPQRSNQVIVSVVFSNLTANHIKDLEFNVLDTLNTKLSRGIGQSGHDAVQVPFVLPAQVVNEGHFSFTVDSIAMATKMKGTLTYIIKTEDGSSHEKLDFTIHFPCSSFLVATACNGSDYASILGSGELTEKATIRCKPSSPHFGTCLIRACFFNNLKVVEKVENSASLYAKSIQGHHICLLVKSVTDEVVIDGKSTDQTLLSNVLEDIRSTLTTEPL